MTQASEALLAQTKSGFSHSNTKEPRPGRQVLQSNPALSNNSFVISDERGNTYSHKDMSRRFRFIFTVREITMRTISPRKTLSVSNCWICTVLAKNYDGFAMYFILNIRPRVFPRQFFRGEVHFSDLLGAKAPIFLYCLYNSTIGLDMQIFLKESLDHHSVKRRIVIFFSENFLGQFLGDMWKVLIFFRNGFDILHFPLRLVKLILFFLKRIFMFRLVFASLSD